MRSTELSTLMAASLEPRANKTNGCSKLAARNSKLDLLQHPRRHQLLLNMPLQNLDQELPQIRAQRLRPIDACKLRRTRPQHLRRNLARLWRHLRRRQPLIIRADQAISQRVPISPRAIERSSTNRALAELW